METVPPNHMPVFMSSDEFTKKYTKLAEWFKNCETPTIKETFQKFE